MLPPISPFSDSYLLIDNIFVEPSTDDATYIHEDFYAHISDDVYEGADAPITLKHDRVYFTVAPSSDTPVDVMEVPSDRIEEWGLETPPSREQMFLAKPETARTFQRFFFA